MFAKCKDFLNGGDEFYAMQARAHALSGPAAEAFWTDRYTEMKTCYVDFLIRTEDPESFQAMHANATRQIMILTSNEPLTGCGKFYMNYKQVDSLVQNVTSLCRASCLVSMGPLGQSILERALAKFEC